MGKRRTVQLNEHDEEYLKSVMAGDVPSNVLKRIIPGEKKENTTNQETELEPVKEKTMPVQTLPPEVQIPTNAPKPATRRKHEPKDYESLFLVKRIPSEKRQTYVSKEIYNKIGRFLPVIKSNISITAFLDNILLHHLEEYQDEINALYDKNYKRPL